MRFFLFLLLLQPFTTQASTEESIRKIVIENFQLIEAAEMKLKSQEAIVLSNEGNFDHKLNFKSRNKIEDKYDNQYFESTLERNTGVKGINLVLGHRQGTGNFAPYDGKYETSAAGEIFAGFSIPLLRNFKTDEYRTNLQVANIEKKQAEEQLKLKQNIYIHKALSLYYKWLLEKRKLEIRRSILKLAEDRNEMISKRFKSGDVEKIKLTDNQRSINKRKSEILKAEIVISNLEALLPVYAPGIDLANLNIENAAFDLKALPLPDLPKTISDDIPQLSILDLEKQKLTLLEELYRQQKLPGLGLNVLGAKELSSTYPYDPERLEVAVKFDFPLENRKAKGKTVAQEYKVKSLSLERDYTKREIDRTYDYNFNAIQLCINRWGIISEEVKNATALATAEKNKWEQGASDLYIVNLREEDVADASINKWSVLYEYQQFVIDAKLFNGTISKSL